MSFSLDIKEEIIRKDFTPIKKWYLLKGFISYNAHLEIDDQTIWCHLMSISPTVVRKIFLWLKEKYHIEAEFWSSKQTGFSRNSHYHFKFNEDKYGVLKDLKIQKLSNWWEQMQIDPKLDPALLRAYVAGIFIATGSVNTPTSAKYHLALHFRNYDQAWGFAKLMREFNFHFKVIQHKKRFVCYLKQSAVISDFLKFIDATKAIFEFEDHRIYRDMTSSINRLNNIEIHNQQVTNKAADRQTSMIEKMKNQQLLREMPSRIRDIANLRLANPEASLQELANIYNNKYQANISKSGVNHWFRTLEAHFYRYYKKS